MPCFIGESDANAAVMMQYVANGAYGRRTFGMKRALCIACAAVLALAPAAACAEGGEKAAVIIMDAAGCPDEAADEPWLMQPCVNPEHYYFKPIENGEPDTLISHALNTRFIADRAAMRWRPWLNHYEKRDGAYWRIEQGKGSGCIFADGAARQWAKRAADELIAAGYGRIALVTIGATGDERADTRLLNMNDAAERDELYGAMEEARCPAVRDRADAIMRAAVKLQDAGAGGNMIVLITAGESDSGPYERRAMEACIRLCGREEGHYISPFVHIREKTRARFAVISIGRAQDALSDMLYCLGAPRLRVQP